MTRKRSLARVLARQWVVFGLLLFAGFAVMSVLTLFVLEDSFIDRRIRDVAQEISARGPASALPARFERLSPELAPPAMAARMHGLRDGAIREFRLPDGRYVHVLVGRDPQGRRYLLSYDVSDQLNVNAALAQGWPWLLLAGAALALLAYGLARRFVGRVSRQARDLLSRVGEAEGPQRLQALAAEEDILEFSELARLSAEAWDKRLAALERERQTLAFLAHELRTPLQSARTSLALLDVDRGNALAWQRLARAQDRLARASHAILWLGTAGPVPDARSPVAPVLDALLSEFAPLAANRRQVVSVGIGDDASWPMPPEVIETVLANLLLNAIQHGGAGDIALALDDRGLRLANPAADGSDAAGFGLGLALVQRLLERFGWRLERNGTSGHVVRVGPADAVEPARW